ncbi:alpha/beta-hydrolase, partial [Neoconidiobolus thromboides FSU 785]
RSDIRVHLPLYESSKKITKEAEPILTGLLKQEKYKGYRLVVLGHSLGGALAPLAAMDLKDILKLKKSEIELHVFDTPRVGNIVFANIVNYHFNKLTRVTHGYDPIPRSLLKMAHYSHFANELYYPPID